MPPITYSNNDMLDLSAAFGSFHVKSSSTSFVNSLMTDCGLPFILTVTFRRSTSLTVSCLSVRWYTDHRYWSMQTSCTRHSSRVSVELTAPLLSGGVSGASACEGSGNGSSRVAVELAAFLASLCTRSGVLAVAICTGGVSGPSISEESGNDSLRGSAEVTTSSVSVCNTSDVPIAAICTGGVSGAGICEESGNAASAIAVTAGAADTATAFETPVFANSVARSLFGAAWVFLMSAKPKPATAAMTQPRRMTVPHNAAAIIPNRCGFIIPSPHYRLLEPCKGKNPTALIFRIKNDRTMTRTAACDFF